MLQPVVIDQFGGLRLDLDPEEVGFGGAVDMLNVDVSTQGRLRTRAGTLQFLTGIPANYLPLAVATTTSGQVLTAWKNGSNYVVYAHDPAGTLLATDAATQTLKFVNLGTPTGAKTYFIELSGGTIATWNGTAFGTIATGVFYTLTVSSTDNRLVVSELTYSGSGGYNRVRFSDAGNPSTFTANNYVDLDPGDGENIHNLVTWRDLVFAFKQTKFFVFTGTTTVGTGTPIFNYRSVRTGIGARAGGVFAVAAKDGVYFVTNDGAIMRTVGEEPVRISQPIDAWLRLGANDQLPLATSLPTLPALTDVSLSSDGQRVFYRVGTRTFTFDTETQAWSVSDLQIRSAVASSKVNASLLAIQNTAQTNNKIVNQSRDYSTDDGSAISWTYRTGLSDLGTPSVKVVRQAEAWGTGAPTVSVLTDHNTTDAGASSVTLGTSPAVAHNVQPYARRGTFFSVGLSGTAPAAIHRAQLQVQQARVPAVG